MLDITKLCKILRISQSALTKIISNIDDYYYLNSTPKLGKDGKQLINKNGSPRTRDLYPSIDRLKILQTTIYNSILKKIKLPSYAFGGIAKRDNVLNAKMHQGNKYFLNTDLRNFYPLIKHTDVYKMFVANKFAPEVAHILTKLTTYKGQLPQGTPTSPYLANLVFVKAGSVLQEFATLNEFTFTTFVDDITISGKNDFKDQIPMVLDIITSKGFKISHNKTFYQTKQPKVTNVIVKNNGLALAQSYKKKIDEFEDKSTSIAKGTINYYNRVHKISKTKAINIKKDLGIR